MQPNKTCPSMALTTSLLYCSLLIIFTNLQTLQAKEWRQNHRHNLFDPIYAYDDVDAHYVSPSLSSSASSLSPPSAPRSSPSTPPANQQIRASGNSVNQAEGDRVRLLLSKIPETHVADKDSSRRLTSVGPKTSAETPMATTARSSGTRTTQVGAINTTQAARESDETTAAESSRVHSMARSSQMKPEEPPHYWSGLENYYQKLRQAAAASQRLHQLPAHIAYQAPAQDLYEIVQQQQEIDDPYSNYRQLGSYLPASVVTRHPVAKLNPAFLLPIVGSSLTMGNQQQEQQQQQQQLLPISYPDNLNDRAGLTVYHNSAPGISKQSGEIGAGSILLRPRESDSTSLAGDLASSLQVNNNANEPFAIVGDDGKIKYLEWRKLPEMLLIQQQQQRVRHQQETFGSWYDQRRSKELLQEEAFCGPRNYVNLRAAQQQQQAGGTKGMDMKELQAQLNNRLQASTSIKLEDVQAFRSPGEYPSHMGLYNGSVQDDNFLCAATWIHESFALTLASCVRSMEPRQIVFRIGEWNLNRSNQSDSNQLRPLIMGQVNQIHLFPKYRNDSMEHNLALVQFVKPVEFLNWPYICPACQIQSRSSIRTSSCWTPSRNVSLIEYFDANGEGETKERKSIGMVELPVKLMANDEVECQRQTGVKLFNFQHPNYICAGDYRYKSMWRASMNNSNTFGSGIYCNEDGNLNLVSIVHPIHSNSSSAYGYMDLTYYKPWIRNIISGRNY